VNDQDSEDQNNSIVGRIDAHIKKKMTYSFLKRNMTLSTPKSLQDHLKSSNMHNFTLKQPGMNQANQTHM
jgi:hypothetical protein